jgi:hypothetical protein
VATNEEAAMTATTRLLAAAALAAAGAGWTAAEAGAHDRGVVLVRAPAVSHARECVWRPGRWVERTERVVVRGGHWRTEAVPAAFALRWSLSEWRLVRVCVRPATVRRVWVPPVVEERRVRTFEPGRWECRGRCGC